jgi:hypothetical protein
MNKQQKRRSRSKRKRPRLYFYGIEADKGTNYCIATRLREAQNDLQTAGLSRRIMADIAC